MMRVRIAADFYIQKVADRPVAGAMATAIRKISCGMICKVDGLAPYGHGGTFVITNGCYEVVSECV